MAGLTIIAKSAIGLSIYQTMKKLDLDFMTVTQVGFAPNAIRNS